VVTDDPDIYEKIRLWRNHGAPRKYYHDLVGFNYRMDSLTGAVLSIKLGHLEAWTEIRRARAGLYREELAGCGLVLPVEPAGARHVYHLFVVRAADRDSLGAFLAARGLRL